MTPKRSPYSGTTRHPRSRWCGAMSEVVLDNGDRINVICTRFAEHKTLGKKDRFQHFDEVRRRSWYDEPNPAIDPPS